MGGDVIEAQMNLGNAVWILSLFGFRNQTGAFLVCFQHVIDQTAIFIRRFLRNPTDADIARHLDRAFVRHQFAANQ